MKTGGRGRGPGVYACGILLAATAAAAAAAQAPKATITHATLKPSERTFDSRLEGAGGDERFMLLGTTRGVYLAGYGAVFSAEINLFPGTPLSPFKQSRSKQEIETIRARKLQRLPLLKQMMQEQMRSMAKALDSMPDTEQIVLAVSLVYYHSWEDTTGLPDQIVMKGSRRELLSGAPIQTEEF